LKIQFNQINSLQYFQDYGGLCNPYYSWVWGDIYPITAGGKIFTFVILMLGLGIVAVPTGLFASALTKARESP